MFRFWKKQEKSVPETGKTKKVEEVESKKKEVSKNELKEIIRIVLADSTVSGMPYLKPELCKSAPDLLAEREELKRLLSDDRFKVLPHVAAGYKEKIKEINLKLDHLKRIAYLITSGYPLAVEHVDKQAGFVRDPGRVMRIPDGRSYYDNVRDTVRIHHHSVYFRPIPLRVLEKHQTVKPLFDVCLVFSKENEAFLSIVDQDMGGRWENVKEGDGLRKQVEEKIKKMRYEDEKVLMVGFLPLRPEVDLRCEFSLYVGDSKVAIHNGLGFQITSWNPKGEMEKNSNKILVAQPTAS